jgi:hypothetical protein
LIIIAHRILIGTAIAFGVFFALWEAVAYWRGGRLADLAMALATAVVTVAMAYYLRNLKRFVG